MASEEMRDVLFAFPFHVAPRDVERPSEVVDFYMGISQIRIEAEDQVSESGVLVGAVRSVGVVELSGQVSDAFVAILDGRTECFGRRCQTM